MWTCCVTTDLMQGEQDTLEEREKRSLSPPELASQPRK